MTNKHVVLDQNGRLLLDTLSMEFGRGVVAKPSKLFAPVSQRDTFLRRHPLPFAELDNTPDDTGDFTIVHDARVSKADVPDVLQLEFVETRMIQNGQDLVALHVSRYAVWHPCFGILQFSRR